jgi:hypothetical protein
MTNRALAQDGQGGAAFQAPDMIEMPTARMEPDGELSASFQYLRHNERFNLGFQALPWLQAHFQYSGLTHYNSQYSVYWDRSFGLKARLWDETPLVPAVSLGIDDLVGTGIFGGEYLVASKRLGDVDTSFGMGWGIYGSTNLFRNPLALISNSFNSRNASPTSGGTSFNLLFHGQKVGLFGGATWHTPIDGLSLIAEYSSNTYQRERISGNLLPKSQLNYEVVYKVSNATTLNLGWLYGTTLGGGITFSFDAVHPQYPQTIEPPPPPVAVRTDEQRLRALEALGAMGDPRRFQQNQVFETRSADRNGFVDALWQQSDDYIDIKIRQNMLDLTISGMISITRCATIARLLQGVAVDINRVKLSNAAEKYSISCLVPRTIQRPPISATFLSTVDLQHIKNLPIQVQTIDATMLTSKTNRAKAEKTIRAAITGQHIFVHALSLGEGELVIYYQNDHYLSESAAVDRIVRILTKEAPPEIEKFRLIAVSYGIPLQEFNVLRAPVERSYEQEDETVFNNSISVVRPGLSQPVLAQANNANYPKFSWNIYPQMHQALFDPNQPLGVQFLATTTAAVELAPGFAISGGGEVNLYDNFNTSRTSDSLLPHVRSDFVKYFTQGKNGIGWLRADYGFRLSPEIFASVRAGYLESMFAGAGGEILWRPQGSRWALGADAYEVWQRDFDRLLGLQHYHQSTGHVSLYYDSPWYGLNFELRAGKYLAGDNGVTIQITRRFSTGVEIGAFFTKTNVSSALFGEGSFDKGIIIRIPLNWVAPFETQSQIAMDLRPVQRDGGQVLSGDATLYDVTRATSEGELLRHESGILLSNL